MKRIIRKFLVMIMITAMCVCMVNVFVVQAGYNGQIGNIYWTQDDTGVLYISGHGNIDKSLGFLHNSKTVIIEFTIDNIGDDVFYEWEKLTSVIIRHISGTSRTSIGDRAFYLCENLTSIIIPDSVTSIGYNAFAGCRSLKDVYYSGTEEEWNRIIIYNGNNFLTSANIHFEYTSFDLPVDTGTPVGVIDNEPPAGNVQPQDMVIIADLNLLPVINLVTQTGWVFDDNDWYYYDQNGKAVTGWLFDNGYWYYLYQSGAMVTGWVYDNGYWYYLYPSGAMATGWICDSDAWYYLSKSGAMVTGWELIDNTWYYFDESGVLID